MRGQSSKDVLSQSNILNQQLSLLSLTFLSHSLRGFGSKTAGRKIKCLLLLTGMILWLCPIKDLNQVPFGKETQHIWCYPRKSQLNHKAPKCHILEALQEWDGIFSSNRFLKQLVFEEQMSIFPHFQPCNFDSCYTAATFNSFLVPDRAALSSVIHWAWFCQLFQQQTRNWPCLVPVMRS